MTRLEQLLDMHRQNPKDSFLLFALAKEYEKLGKEEDALEWYQKLQQLDPDYVGVYYHLGKLFEEKGETEKALNTYARGIEVAQKLGDLHAKSELQSAKMNLEMEELL
jgi:tetratricopeptide (TPR) repeat protein